MLSANTTHLHPPHSHPPITTSLPPHPPSKTEHGTQTHPFRLAPLSLAPTLVSGGGHHLQHKVVAADIYVHLNKSLQGLYIKHEHAEMLGLNLLEGLEETMYGDLPRYEPLLLLLSTRAYIVKSVFQLPKAFKGSIYENGIVGLSLLSDLGVVVGVDRGHILILDSEVVGGLRKGEGDEGVEHQEMEGRLGRLEEEEEVDEEGRCEEERRRRRFERLQAGLSDESGDEEDG
ncbi:hypothetical protein HDV05_002388 [Chytridiales sp. JEL 0842]|nr:hypothetical protein HDV05_002388 [Chytridiales sp. JEL 0842]